MSQNALIQQIEINIGITLILCEFQNSRKKFDSSRWIASPVNSSPHAEYVYPSTLTHVPEISWGKTNIAIYTLPRTNAVPNDA